jgi:hypothetical protein
MSIVVVMISIGLNYCELSIAVLDTSIFLLELYVKLIADSLSMYMNTLVLRSIYMLMSCVNSSSSASSSVSNTLILFPKSHILYYCYFTLLFIYLESIKLWTSNSVDILIL